MSGEFQGLRIAYFTEWSPYQPNGVLRKMVGQLEAWRELGAQAKMFVLAAREHSVPACGFGSVGDVFGRITADAVSKLAWLRLGYINKVITVSQVARALREFRPDIVYYRQQGPWYPGLGSLLRQAPSVIEVNSDEFAENRLWGPGLARLFSFSQSRVLDRVAGIVAVTEELASRWRRFSRPVAVVPNGFWGAQPGQFAPSGNALPAFAFVGSRFSTSSDWHGIDKILALAHLLPESQFHFIGHSRNDVRGSPIPPNATLHGELGPSCIAEVFSRCDVGLGTMALHRKGMDDACPLKVRDYLMHRMPVVIGYREAEEALNHASFVLRLPNTEDNLVSNASRVRDFAEKWRNLRVEDDLSFMSRSAIEARRLRFLAQFVRG
jgi:hypothetical protein